MEASSPVAATQLDDAISFEAVVSAVNVRATRVWAGGILAGRGELRHRDSGPSLVVVNSAFSWYSY